MPDLKLVLGNSNQTRHWIAPDCRELGYTPVEVNASDTRNKADSKIVAGIGGRKSNVVKELATNAAIGVNAQGRKIKVCPPTL